MSTAPATLNLKTKASAKPGARARKSSPKKTYEKKPRAKSSTRGTTDAENAKVVSMYKAGKSYSEISDAMGWTGKGDFPHSYVHGVILRLRRTGALGYHRKPVKAAKK